MASAIDVTVPVQGNPTTASVRANFTAAKDEIEALQASAANPSIAAGDSITLADTASIVAQDAGGNTTVSISAADPSVQIDCAAGSAVILTDDSQLALGTGGDVTITPDGTDVQVEGAGTIELSGANDVLFSGTGELKLNDDLAVTLGTDDDASLEYNSGTLKLAILTKNNTDVVGSAIDLKTGNVVADTVASIDSPDMNIATGGTTATGAIQAGNSGNLIISTGATTAGVGTSGDSGDATFGSGTSDNDSGITTITSGNAENNSGNMVITTGAATTGAPGETTIRNGANVGFVSVSGLAGHVIISSPNWEVQSGGMATFTDITSPLTGNVTGSATKIPVKEAAVSLPPTQGEITTANGGQSAADAGDGYHFKLKDTGSGTQWVIYSDGTQWLHGPSLMVAAS